MMHDKARRSARDLLGPTGPLAKTFGAYEDRDGQLAMAEAVERALLEQRPLLCEAGTGTGKTLAYLVPAITSGLRVVVSTATKALEEQIFHKDLPMIREHLGLRTDAALVKGLGNYLCLRRFGELRTSPAAITDRALGRTLPMLEAWAGDTETGDVAELSGLADDDPVWRDVASSSETRIGAACEHYDRCFVTRMKRDAEQARVVVVNHHLFCADLAIKAAGGRRGFDGGVLPPYDAVILDEAHQLEDIASSFFGTRVSTARVEAMLRDAERALTAAGLSDRLLSRGEGTALCAMAREAALSMFDLVAELLSRDGAPAPASIEGRTTLDRHVWIGALLDAYHHVDTALEALGGYAEANRITEAVGLIAERAGKLRDDLAAVVEPATHRVTWVERTGGRRSRGGSAAPSGSGVAIGATPVDLGDLLRHALFERVGAVVLTSATLTTGKDGDFRFVRSRLGLGARALDDPEAAPVPSDFEPIELAVPSPFDHASRSLLYTPTDLPEVADAAFVPAAAERVVELVAVTGGGAFVLCTSLRVMRSLASLLSGRLGRRPLVQGEAPKGNLLARFRADGHAVLVATMSFWEGVDVPGDALRLVVIDKIPFAVPTDPVVVARSAALEARGENAFAGYAVPQAAITLKQGFGRLIRTRDDRGIVALLDRRARTKGYGARLLGALPPARRTDHLEDVRAFWAEVAGEETGVRGSA